MTKSNKTLSIMFFTVFLDLVGVGILIPVIPLLLASPGSAYSILPAGHTAAQGYIILGFLTAIYPFMQFLATPILGQLSDHIGRRKVLAFSIAGTCLSYILFAIGIIIHNLPLLFISRAFDGITGGNIAVAQAAIADVTPPKERAKNFGLIGAAFGLGFIIGPFLGGKLSDPNLVHWFSATTPFWFAAILCFLNTLSIIFFFPETIHHISHARIDWSRSFHNIGKAFQSGVRRTLFAVSFLFSGGFTFFTSFVSVYFIFKFGFNQGHIGNYFALVGIAVAFTQGIITRGLAGRISEQKILTFSILLTAITLYFLHLSSKPWMVYLLVLPQAIGIGLTNSNLLALISHTSDARTQGEVLGISSSVQALAQSIPPVLSGYIAAVLSPSAPIWIASFVIFAGWLIFLFFYRKQNKGNLPSSASILSH